MSDTSKDMEGPRSDFAHSLGKEVEVRFTSADYASKLGFEQSCQGRLVGVERMGLWFEPGSQRKQALDAGKAVGQYFVPWTEVATVIRWQEASLFQSKKEYRGLRPS